MSQLPLEQRPLSVEQLDRRYRESVPELAALGILQQAGFRLTPLVVIPAEAEEAFYLLNNLPTQLAELFAGIDLNDPDEDDIEELAPQAEALFRSHYLLDEFIDVFYESLKPLSGKLMLRRPGQRPGLTAVKGRPSLLALKTLWTQDWGFAALMRRLQKTGRLGLEPRPTLISLAGELAAPALNKQAEQLLGREVNLYELEGVVTEVVFV